MAIFFNAFAATALALPPDLVQAQTFRAALLPIEPAAT